MKPDFLTNLPPEISFDIISRLPLRSIAISKCVCKPWLHLLETDDFVRFHLSKSVPSLAVLSGEGLFDWCKVYEFGDEVDLENSHDRRYDPLTKFEFTHLGRIGGSANGLLLLRYADSLYVCNPITSELCQLRSFPRGIAYGFGASRISGQIKLISINPAESDCRVWTLGTGSSRRIEGTAFRYGSDYNYRSFGAFVNGNLHWLVSSDLDGSKWVSCLDVETECFSTFPAPPPFGSCNEHWRFYDSWLLHNLRDFLCFSEESAADEIAIWLVKDYEGDKLWSKEFVIDCYPDFLVFGMEFLRPVKVFRNGDLLMLCNPKNFLYYSKETKTTQRIGSLGAGDEEYYFSDLVLITPSFLSLRRSLGMENVVIV